MKKNKLTKFLFILAFLLPIYSCNTTNKEPIKDNTDLSDNEKPERSDKTQFYLKNNFDNVYRGMMLNLNDYIEVIPGKNESDSATTFVAKILNGEETKSVAYFFTDSTKQNKLVLTSPGVVYLQVSANNESIVYEINVKESKTFDSFKSTLNKTESNYEFERMKLNQDTNNRDVLLKGYRGNNYFYNETNKIGFLLSTKDDNVYNFNLDSINSDIDIILPPAGKKNDFLSRAVNLSKFSDSSYWGYTTNLSRNTAYSRYTYMFSGTSEELDQFFFSLYYINGVFTVNGTYYYPATVYSYEKNNELYFLPVLMNSSGTSIGYLPEVRVYNIGGSKVPTLDKYIDEMKAPVKPDTSKLISALNYINNKFDYTVSANSKVYDSKGKVVSKMNPYYSKYFEDFGYYPKTYITKDAFWDNNFHGSWVSGTIIPGGLFTENKKTYHYYEVDGKYKNVGEYIMAGSTSSSAYWYGYQHIARFVMAYAYGKTDIENGYPEVDLNNYTYKYLGSSEAGAKLIANTISFGYFNPLLTNDKTLVRLIQSQYASVTFNIDYDDNGLVIALHANLEITYPKTLLPIDQNYTWKLAVTVDDIGSTNSELETILNSIVE